MNMSILIPLLAIAYLSLIYAMLLLAQQVRKVQSNRT